MHRSSTRLASYAWRGWGLGIGLCLPPSNGHLAEWQNNLTGIVRFAGDGAEDGQLGGPPHRQVARHDVHPFEGGFATVGTLLEGASLELAEGWKRSAHSAQHHVAFVALPDAHTVVGLQLCRTEPHRTYIRDIQGLALQIPNDLFNGGHRTIETANGRESFSAPPTADEDVPLGSVWACVEGQLGVVGLYGAETLTLARHAARQGGRYPSLHVETLCYGRNNAVTAFGPSATVLDSAWVVLASVDAPTTRRVAESPHCRRIPSDGDLRSVEVEGRDGRIYWIAANFGEEANVLTLPRPAHDLVQGTDAPAGELTLRAHSIAVLAQPKTA